MLRPVALALAVALPLGLTAAAQPAEEAQLPAVGTEVWAAERLSAGAPPGINGAIAQIRAPRGEGRFAVICARGDARGTVAFRPPTEARPALREAGDALRVRFQFDNGETIIRNLEWNDAGRYWTGAFGPNSELAEQMKRRMSVTVNVLDHPGVASDFTLIGSFRAIEAMFAMCRI